MPEDELTIWFSGKEMQRGKLLSDYVGKNEKTKVIVKIQKKGGAAPGREPVVSDEQQKEMMAYYYRKQQDMKVSEMLILFSINLHSFENRNSKKMKIIHTWIPIGLIKMR